MAELTHRLADLTRESQTSRYARMIPGAAGVPGSSNRETHVSGKSDPRSTKDNSVTPITGRRNQNDVSTRFQAGDRVGPYQLAAADFMVVLAACLVPSIFFPDWSLPRATVPVYAVLFILLALNEGLYNKVGSIIEEELMILAKASVCSMALVLISAWRQTQPIAAMTAAVVSCAGLLLFRQFRTRRWNSHFGPPEPRNVLVIGAGPIAQAVARALRDDPFHAATVVGFLDDHRPRSPQVLGRIADLDWLARAQFIDEVILAVTDEPTVLRDVAEVALRNHLDIRAVPGLPAGLWPEAGVERLGGIPMITLHRESLPSVTLLLKRLLDVTGALAGLAVIAPVMAALALLIRLDSPGPIFYAAQRAGTKGRPFRCYKLRSMTTDADQRKEKLRDRNQREGPIFKIADDPRITRFGRFLRRYSLDELPQLWNVLRGEMSLVGPRPHPVDEVNHYQLHHYRRLDMKPGITGLWQITARNSPSFELNMHLDLIYIENWNLALDFRILVSTIHVLFAPEGA